MEKTNTDNKPVKKNKPFDLIWIIPEIIGTIFFTLYVPVIFIKVWSSYEKIFSPEALLYLSIAMLLMGQLSWISKSINEFFNIQWK